MLKKLLTIFLCLMTFNVMAQDQISKLPFPSNPAQSFETAKKRLYSLYKTAEERKTFYCGCNFNEKNQVDLASCGYVVRKSSERAKRVEAEHIFPASQFGHFRTCWRKAEEICGKGVTGRKCCEAKDPTFEMAHNDLHNLVPAIGEVNGDRSDFNWGMIPNSKTAEYGQCEIKIDRSIKRVEPPNKKKGDVARIYFYMEDAYDFKLSDQDRQLFTAWDKLDPVDDWERERNRRIAEIQGNLNPFITDDSNELGDSSKNTAPSTTPNENSAINTPAPINSESEFSCATKKTCGQMSGCEEAKYHLNVCNNKSLDRDGNGVPCESICK